MSSRHVDLVRVLYRGVAFTVLALVSSPSFAQSTAPDDGKKPSEGIGEIVVTAQRREQSLQRVPVAVTAISGQELQQRNIQSANNLAGLVPGFAVRDAAETIQYNLRGYVSTDSRANSDAPVAVYIDDVFLGATVLQQMQVIDVDRIEALRGPQGTLFGRNAVGGLIHFISNKPTDTLDGYVGVQYGSYNELIADGAIGGPLAPGLTGRIALKYDRDDGWQRNLSGGRNRSAKNAIVGRAQLKYEITPNLTESLSFQFDRERNQYQGYTSLGALNAAGTSVCSYRQIVASQCFLGGAAFSNVPAGTKSLATYKPTEIYSTLRSDPDVYDAQLAISRLDWDANPSLQISSITSWAFGRRSFIEDDNATGLAANAPFNFLSHSFNSRQLTQEFRASGAVGQLKYVGGLYYLRSTKNLFVAQLDDSATRVDAYLAPREKLTTTTMAAFAQAELPITSTLSIIGGGRYTWERKALDREIQFGFVTLGPVTQLPDSSASLSRFTGKAGLQWTPSSSFMLYGHFSTGFKSGEYPADSSNAPLTPVAPETIEAFEIGEKVSLFDNRLRLNVSGFINKISDKQAVTTTRDVATGSQVSYFINFGDVDQKGFEAELTLRPVDGLTLGGSVAYVDNAIRPRAGVTIQRLAFFNSYSLDGNELAGAPPWQETLTADWRLPLNMAGRVNLRLDWRFQSKTFWSIANDPVEQEPAYNVGDLRLTYTAPANRWSLTGFVTNVTNKRYSVVNFSFAGSDVLTVQWAKPRWAGARLAYNF